MAAREGRLEAPISPELVLVDPDLRRRLLEAPEIFENMARLDRPPARDLGLQPRSGT